MSNDYPEIPIDTLAETENYTIWAADEPDGEKTYHLELGPVTAHFFSEEWNDFLELIEEAEKDGVSEMEGDMEIELDWGSLLLTREEWDEFIDLISQMK